MRLFLRLLPPLLALSALAAPAVAGDRRTVAERAGCTISVGDRNEQGIDLIVADCAWPIAPEKVIRVVRDAGAHDDYLSSVKESTVLPDGRVLQVHTAKGIADRQITLRFTHEPLPDGGFRVSWTRDPVQEPLVEGRVEAVQDDGFWEVRPDGRGGSRVTYGLRYDPGGRVPTFIVRAFQKGGIADLVEEMRRAAER